MHYNYVLLKQFPYFTTAHSTSANTFACPLVGTCEYFSGVCRVCRCTPILPLYSFVKLQSRCHVIHSAQNSREESVNFKNTAGCGGAGLQCHLWSFKVFSVIELSLRPAQLHDTHPNPPQKGKRKINFARLCQNSTGKEEQRPKILKNILRKASSQGWRDGSVPSSHMAVHNCLFQVTQFQENTTFFQKGMGS